MTTNSIGQENISGAEHLEAGLLQQVVESDRGSATTKWLAGVGLALGGLAAVLPQTHAAMARHEGQRVTAEVIAEATDPSAADVVQAEEAGRLAAEEYSYPDMLVDGVLRNRNKWELFLDVQVRDPETKQHDSDNTRANIGSLLFFSGLLVMEWNKRGAKSESRDRRFRKENKVALESIERRRQLQQERKITREQAETVFSNGLASPEQLESLQGTTEAVLSHATEQYPGTESLTFEHIGRVYAINRSSFPEHGTRTTVAISLIPRATTQFSDGKNDGYRVTVPGMASGASRTLTISRERIPGGVLPIIGEPVETEKDVVELIGAMGDFLRNKQQEVADV